MQALELAVLPLDVARRATLRLATRSAWLTRVLGRRDSRIACLATLQVLLLFALAVRAPVALFFLGPVVLGVAHLAADVRYLVLRRAPPRPLVFASIALALLVTAVRVAVGLRHLSVARGNELDVALGMLWIGIALASALRGKRRATLIAAPLFLGAAALCVMNVLIVGVALIHLHNVIAVVAWLALFRARRAWAALPVSLAVGLTLVLLSGANFPWTFNHGGLLAFGVHAERLGAWLAPGVAPPRAVALATTFVFLQGIHYAVWTGWIPQDDLRTQGTPTFRMSVRRLTADFGPLALGLIVLVAMAFFAIAAWDVQKAVSWYMTLAKSHAWFELALLGYFFAAGRRPGLS